MNIYPVIANDMEHSILYEKKEKTIYCIGSFNKDKYIFVETNQIQCFLLAFSYMDGSMHLDEIREKLHNDHLMNVDIEKLYSLCLESGFIENAVETNKKKFNELDSLFVTILSIKLEKLRNFFLMWSNKKYLFILFLMIVTSGIGTTLFFVNAGNFEWGSIISDVRALIFFTIISFISIIMHEFSHAIVATKYGLKVTKMNFALFAYVTFVVYVKLPGIYFLSRHKKIIIWSAGIFTNFFLATLFYILMYFTKGQLHLFLSMGVICNISLIVFSILPFYLSDGYFILATICKAPNLRKNAFSDLLKFLKGHGSKDSIVYISYLVITGVFIISFLAIRINFLIISIIDKTKEGLSAFQIAYSYLNFFILIFVGTLSKVISIIIKKQNNCHNLKNQ